MESVDGIKPPFHQRFKGLIVYLPLLLRKRKNEILKVNVLNSVPLVIDKLIVEDLCSVKILGALECLYIMLQNKSGKLI